MSSAVLGFVLFKLEREKAVLLDFFGLASSARGVFVTLFDLCSSVIVVSRNSAKSELFIAKERFAKYRGREALYRTALAGYAV